MVSKFKISILLCGVFLTILSFEGKSQQHEFGFFLGGSYYNGELNPRKHFAQVTSPAVGVVYINNFNSRYSLRYTAIYGTLKANDNITEIGLNNFRNLDYTSQLLEFSGQIVFNFNKYGRNLNSKPYTPYLFAGLSIFNVQPQITSMEMDSTTAFPGESYSTNLTSVSFPFGFGFKAIMGNITLGLEWSMRKTFTDKVDGLDNQYSFGNTYEDPVEFTHPIGFQKGNFSNNDWYSFAGITITFRPSASKKACPGVK